MICDNCGCDIPENQNTCPNCGCDCDKKAASSDTHTKKTKRKSNKVNSVFPDSDWRKQTPDDNAEDKSDESESQHVYPTMCQRGTDEGLPDMDLGKSTRYYAKKRKTPVEKTRWEKYIESYRPPKDSAPEAFSAAAKKNVRISVLLNIFSMIGFYCGLYWFLTCYNTHFLVGLLCPISTCTSIFSIDCADTAADYYKKDRMTSYKKCTKLKFICRALFWLTFFASLIVLATEALFLTGYPDAYQRRFIIW